MSFFNSRVINYLQKYRFGTLFLVIETVKSATNIPKPSRLTFKRYFNVGCINTDQIVVLLLW